MTITMTSRVNCIQFALDVIVNVLSNLQIERMTIVNDECNEAAVKDNVYEVEMHLLGQIETKH